MGQKASADDLAAGPLDLNLCLLVLVAELVVLVVHLPLRLLERRRQPGLERGNPVEVDAINTSQAMFFLEAVVTSYKQKRHRSRFSLRQNENIKTRAKTREICVFFSR